MHTLHRQLSQPAWWRRGTVAYSSGHVILFAMLSLHYTDTVFYFTSLLCTAKDRGHSWSFFYSTFRFRMGEDIIIVAQGGGLGAL